MLIVVPQLLARDAALSLGQRIAGGEWVDGNISSGAAAALAKRNRQLVERDAVAVAARREVQTALAGNALFLSAALPARIRPPMFNRYGVGETFGAHVDNAIRLDDESGVRLRTDLSATLFLSDPAEYDGGELVIAGAFGEIAYKCAAGDLLLYPASSLHHVTPITRGERLASFFWVQSLVRDDAARTMLFELDQSIQTLAAERGAAEDQVLRLTNVYHNLVRRWADP